MTEDDLLTTAEAAQVLGKSVPTVNRWAAEGWLPCVKRTGGDRGARMFRRSDVEALLTNSG